MHLQKINRNQFLIITRLFFLEISSFYAFCHVQQNSATVAESGPLQHVAFCQQNLTKRSRIQPFFRFLINYGRIKQFFTFLNKKYCFWFPFRPLHPSILLIDGLRVQPNMAKCSIIHNFVAEFSRFLPPITQQNQQNFRLLLSRNPLTNRGSPACLTLRILMH